MKYVICSIEFSRNPIFDHIHVVGGGGVGIISVEIFAFDEVNSFEPRLQVG